MSANVVAIILAGGKGTRLKELTLNRPKPAISFAGKYRLIDFVLSNCTNSGVEQVGVLTQYEPLELNSYIGEGSSWDLDVYGTSVTVMGPYTSRDYGFTWQGGTAEAVILNYPFIQQYNPDYLLVLSADHVYKMDYSKMIEYHIRKEAEVTIASIRVPKEETHRFGMLKIHEDYRIIDFKEKPSETDSELASMGIYIFNWERFKQGIVNNYYYKHQYEGVDFGKDVIPNLIKSGVNIFAYEYEGYWRDVGTVESYWKAHMDLLKDEDKLKLHDYSWPIFSKTPNLPPHHILKDAIVKNAWINEGCMIFGEVYNSVLAHKCVIEKESVIEDSVILTGAFIENDCYIKYAVIGDGVRIPAHSELVGSEKHILLVTVDNRDEILENQSRGNWD